MYGGGDKIRKHHSSFDDEFKRSRGSKLGAVRCSRSLPSRDGQAPTSQKIERKINQRNSHNFGWHGQW